MSPQEEGSSCTSEREIGLKNKEAQKEGRKADIHLGRLWTPQNHQGASLHLLYRLHSAAA